MAEAEADAALAANGLTLAAGADRILQAALKDALDRANNNKSPREKMFES